MIEAKNDAGTPEMDERYLREALATPRLSASALKRVCAHVRIEWQLAVAPKRRMNARLWIAGLALSVGLTLATWIRVDATSIHRPAGVVLEFPDGGMLIERHWWSDRYVGRDSAMVARSRYYVPNTTAVRLLRGGRVTVRAGSSFRTVDDDTIDLLGGSVYVDIPPGGNHSAFSLRTPFGTIQHVGTQFEVVVDSTMQRIRVREGSVRFGRVAELKAGEELEIAASGRQHRGFVHPYGAEWNWAESSYEPMDLEGMSAATYLQTAARQTGRELDFSDDGTRLLAQGITLHGSTAGLHPLQAVGVVLATTSLLVRAENGRIVVSTAPTKVAPRIH